MNSLESNDDTSVGEGGRGRTFAKVPTQEGVADRHPNLFEECVEIHLEGVTQPINLGTVHCCILRELKSSREQVLTGNEAHKRKVEILEIQHTQKTLELALIRNELHTARTSNDAMKELLRTVQSYCALLLDEIETMKKKRIELQRRCTVGRSTKKGIHVVRQGVVPRSTQQIKKEETKKETSGLEQVRQKRGRDTDHTDGARSPANKGKHKRKKQANHSTSVIYGTVADGNDEATQLISGPFKPPR